MSSPASVSTFQKIRRGGLSLAFAAAAGLTVAGNGVKAYDDTLTAFGPVPAEELMDNHLFDLARKVGSIIHAAAADRRRVQSIGVNVDAMNRQGGGHIIRPEKSFKA